MIQETSIPTLHFLWLQLFSNCFQNSFEQVASTKVKGGKEPWCLTLFLLRTRDISEAAQSRSLGM